MNDPLFTPHCPTLRSAAMSRRSFVKTVGYGAGALAMPTGFGACRTTALRPNFVLINVDDLGWSDLACFGSRYYETPKLDRPARQGKKFTQAYAACAVCSPTRVAGIENRNFRMEL